MSQVHLICRSLADMTRRVGVMLAYGADAATVPASPRPQAPHERLRMMITPGLLPRTVQLCIHCRESPAGFWVSSNGGTTVRRPWCLSCCDGLNQNRCDVIPFSS
jgi:hypothetical protein